MTHLLDRLALVEQRVRRAVTARRSTDPEPDDPFRGLYLSDEAVRRILDEPWTVPAPDAVDAQRLAAVEVAAGDSRLRTLARDFGLQALDVELLLIALAPDLDSRFEPLYGYLNDDVTRRRPTVGLALALCGAPAASPGARGRLAASAPLPGRGLLLVEEPDRPFLSRSLRVPDRVTAHLLGDDTPDPRLADLLTPLPTPLGAQPDPMPGPVVRTAPCTGGLHPPVRDEPPGAGVGSGPDLPGGSTAQRPREASATGAPGAVARAGGSAPAAARPTASADRSPARRLGAAVAAGITLAHLREPPGASARGTAAAALRCAGRTAWWLDLAQLAGDPAPAEAVRAAGREAGLRGAGLVAGPVEAVSGRPELIRALTGLPVPVLLYGRATWDPAWSAAVPLLVDVDRTGAADRTALWQAALAAGGVGGDAPATTTADPTAAASFLLTPDQVARAARTARQQAVLSGGPLTDAHLLHGARAQNSSGLERLARRIEPTVGWDDLVLPPAVLGQLRELAARARHRDQVLGDWAMRPGGGRGRGVMALFAGDSGTGKTLSAEVIADALGLDLYTVDLATVVDKYVGETEKNLERIFTEAAGVNAVLLFDEADAVFGKRSEVKDAHDRYANVESAYLLQRMESFDGLAVLATNLRANLDEAFTRRLDLVVDFPLPDADHRTALWERCLGAALPRAADLDLAFCGRSFELAGGDIRSAAVTAAYLAAEAARPVTMADLVRAVAREYRKLGRLCLESEFGPYLPLTRP
ncbi:AAA family ATPase [Kitasatospora sp. NPDC097643]|uniref:AAA family ATPase n=1 Tax=Kitasatospora sp. NPDC097643 TaxID=3157230 RepID=UPI00332ADD81